MLQRFLLFIFTVSATFGFAQTSNQRSVSTEDLEYYLLQSFLVNDSKQRIALNHIGIQGRVEESGFLVTAVLEGYPAHTAGMDRGDVILSADSEPFHPVHSFNLERNSNGDFISITNEYQLRVQRGDISTELSLVPVYENLFDSYRSATANSVQEFSAGNKVIGYIRFWALSRNTNDIINYQELIRNLDHCDGIIFDLRNSFGFLDSQHLDLVFNNKSSYFSITEPPNTTFNFAQTSPALNSLNYRKPIALLVNEDTRGGTELFAYQLDKLERVVSLGNSTPGRIGNFVLNNERDGASIDYLSAEELLIDGNEFEGIGVNPEIEVQFEYENTTRGDPQYDAAVSTLLGII